MLLRRLIWCDSKTDSKVWMREEIAGRHAAELCDRLFALLYCLGTYVSGFFARTNFFRQNYG